MRPHPIFDKSNSSSTSLLIPGLAMYAIAFGQMSSKEMFGKNAVNGRPKRPGDGHEAPMAQLCQHNLLTTTQVTSMTKLT